MKVAVIFALLAVPALAAPPSTCGGTDDYSKALCSYQRRQFAAAEQGFRAIVNVNAQDPSTIKSMYFLARTFMKTGRYAEAEELFIKIYEMDRPFYDNWQCDFLLGVSRGAQGKG